MKIIIIVCLLLMITCCVVYANRYDTQYMQEFVGKIYLHNLGCWRNVARGEIISINEEYVTLHHMPSSFNKKIGVTWSCIDGSHNREDFKYYVTEAKGER